MNTKKLCILMVLIMMISLPACTSEPSTSESETTGAESSTADPTQMDMDTLKVSGLVGGPSDMFLRYAEIFTDKYPGVEIEWISAESTTVRESLLRTAIAAGDPPAAGYYWGTRLVSFYNNGMCTDLNDYFDSDFFNKINESMLQPCIGNNGETFGVPYYTVYHTSFYNKDMLMEYGFNVPETWDEMTEIFERLKKDNIFGFTTNSATMQDSLYGIAYAELETKVGPGTSLGIARGEVSVAPGSPAGEVIREVIEQVKEWYDAGYWYPGEGGINTTREDANAAFAQGRSMFIFNHSGALSAHQDACDFEIGVSMKPTSKKEMTSIDNIEPGVIFIPSNVSQGQLNSALEFIKIALSNEGQQAVVDRGWVPSVTKYDYTNLSPLLQEIMSVLASGDLIAGINPTTTSSEMQAFIKQDIFAAPLSGAMTIDQTLNEMERIRLAVNK